MEGNWSRSSAPFCCPGRLTWTIKDLTKQVIMIMMIITYSRRIRRREKL